MEIAREILEAAKGSQHDARRILAATRKFSTLLRAVAPQMAPFDFQASVMDDWVHRLVHWTKPRQVGASFTISGKAVSKAMAIPGSRSLFLSLSLEDAREKIEYAKEFYDAIERVPGCPLLDQASTSALKFSNGSTIKAVYYPRGKARADLYLDEFAHHPNARKVYRASLPILILGGRMLMASTVLSPTTMFSAIRNGANGKFKTFHKIETRWWDSPLHCADVAAARAEALTMLPEERVAKYGNPALRDLFDNMILEDFLCEFELQELGEEGAWLPWELILKTTPAADSDDHVIPLDVDQFEALMGGDESLRAYLGMDVGRSVNTSEISGIVVGPDGRGHERFSATLQRTDLPKQRIFVERLLRIPRVRIAGDETGMGLMLFEELRRKFGSSRVVGVNFGSNLAVPIQYRDREAPAKFALALTLKDCMVNDEVRWQIDPGKNVQMHSVRRHVTEALNLVLRVDRGDSTGAGMEEGTKHNADVFWARSLGCWLWKMSINLPAIQIVVVGDGDE